MSKATKEYEKMNTNIAELGAAHKAAHKSFIAERKRADQAEAENATLKARRCEGCEAYDRCSVRNAAWVRWRLEPDFPGRGFCCNRWVEEVTP